MKPLDKNKKYDLSQLNDEQLTLFLYELAQKYNTPIRKYSRTFLNEIIEVGNLLCFYEYNGEWGSCSKLYKECTNALELFEEELPLKGSVAIKTEVPKNIDFKKELPNITFTQEESIYDDMLSLIEKGKQHGLKIVVTFEKL